MSINLQFTDKWLRVLQVLGNLTRVYLNAPPTNQGLSLFALSHDIKVILLVKEFKGYGDYQICYQVRM